MYQLAVLLAVSLKGVPQVVGGRQIFTGVDTCLCYPFHHIYHTVSDLLQLIWFEDVVVQGVL